MDFTILLSCLLLLIKVEITDCQAILLGKCSTDQNDDEDMSVKIRELHFGFQNLRTDILEAKKNYSEYRKQSAKIIMTLVTKLTEMQARLSETEAELNKTKAILDDHTVMKVKQLYQGYQQLRDEMLETKQGFSEYRNQSAEKIMALETELQTTKNNIVDTETTTDRFSKLFMLKNVILDCPKKVLRRKVSSFIKLQDLLYFKGT